MSKNDVIEHVNYLLKKMYITSDPRKIWKLKQIIHAYEHKLRLMEEVS